MTSLNTSLNINTDNVTLKDIKLKKDEVRSGTIKAKHVKIGTVEGDIKIKVEHGKIIKCELKGSDTFKARARECLRTPSVVNEIERKIVEYVKHQKAKHHSKHKHH